MVRLMRKSGPLSEDGGDESLFEHKAVSQALTALDRLADEAGLTGLSHFISEDPENVADLVDDEDEAEEILAKLPEVRWSSPEEGLPTVTALAVQVEAGGPSAALFKKPAKVAAELRDLEVILTTAAKKKARFRFFREF